GLPPRQALTLQLLCPLAVLEVPVMGGVSPESVQLPLARFPVRMPPPVLPETAMLPWAVERPICSLPALLGPVGGAVMVGAAPPAAPALPVRRGGSLPWVETTGLPRMSVSKIRLPAPDGAPVVPVTCRLPLIVAPPVTMIQAAFVAWRLPETVAPSSSSAP